jgi:hypothetical protein
MYKEYRQDKEKDLSFHNLVETCNRQKVECPIGSKRAKQEEEDKKPIESALKEAGCITEGGKKGEPSLSCMNKIAGILKCLGKYV